MILADPNAARFYERSGAVRIGEPPSDAVPGLLPPYEIRPDPTLHEPRPGGRKWQPAWNSLIRTKTSLIARFNCLLGRNNFPVPVCREMAFKALILLPNSDPFVKLGGPN